MDDPRIVPSGKRGDEYVYDQSCSSPFESWEIDFQHCIGEGSAGRVYPAVYKKNRAVRCAMKKMKVTHEIEGVSEFRKLQRMRDNQHVCLRFCNSLPLPRSACSGRKSI